MSSTTSRKLVHGVGVNDIKDASKTKVYTLWKDMLQRCYSTTYQNKFPTYKGCSVNEDWLTFSNFKKWHEEALSKIPESLHSNLQLDKDLLDFANKEYSSDKCLLVPSNVNKLMTDSGAKRGKWPLGLAKKGKNALQVKACNGKGKQYSMCISKPLDDDVITLATFYHDTKMKVAKSVLQSLYKEGYTDRATALRIYKNVINHLDNYLEGVKSDYSDF